MGAKSHFSIGMKAKGGIGRGKNTSPALWGQRGGEGGGSALHKRNFKLAAPARKKKGLWIFDDVRMERDERKLLLRIWRKEGHTQKERGLEKGRTGEERNYLKSGNAAAADEKPAPRGKNRTKRLSTSGGKN